MITYTTYINWLTQAYKYYFLDDAEMSDSEWDYWSRQFYANRGELLKESFPIIHREEFTGASLFWLRKEEYPSEVLGILSEGSA